MSRNLDIQLVRTFVAVADNGSMTVAANSLHLTPGAVSQQIKRLEDQFGCILFERDRRRLDLTADGERFLARARRLLALNDETWADMTTRPLQGPLRLGVPYDLVRPYFSRVLKVFGQARPEVELSLVCGSSPELGTALANGALDLAVIEQPADEATGECLRVEPLHWVGARGGKAHLRRPLPVSMVVETCAFRPRVLQALDASGMQWRTVFEGGNIEATRATVHADLAVTAWLASTVPPELDVLSAESGLPALPDFVVGLHFPAQGGTAAALDLAGFVRDGFAERASDVHRTGRTERALVAAPIAAQRYAGDTASA